jgi:tetratricopeptide (TPR) repeat protein
MGAGMGILTVWWERYHQGTQGVFFAFSPLQRFLIASHAVWFYAGKLVWPVHLIFSYPRWTINPKHPLAYGWLAAGGVLCAVIYFARRWVGRSVEVAGLFYVATLSPLLGFIMIYTFRYTFVADHYQYAACIGPLALAAAGMEMGWGRLKRRGAFARPIFFAVLLTALGALTWRQCGMYADEETLWRATIARNPASWMAQDNLAMVLDQEGKLDEAMVHYQASLQIYPDHEEARNNLGTALDRKGKLDEAISQFQIALQINPNGAETRNNLGHALLQKGNVDEALAQYREAIRVKPDYAEAQLGLGNALRQKGSLDEAMVHYQEAARIKPDYAEAHNNLGAALDQKGKVDEAIAHYQSAVQINPGYAEAQMNLGSDLLQKGSLDEAMVHYLGALKSRPDYPEARNNLGNALLRKGRTDEAIAQFQIALRNHPGFAEAQFGLGNALRQMGRFDEAIARFQQALELKPSDAAIQNNLAWVLATCPEASLRNGAKAVELARQANALTGGKNPIILRTLAAALAEAGRFSEALEMAQQALRLAEAQSNSRLAGTLQTEIKLYQAALPFHDPAQKH